MSRDKYVDAILNSFKKICFLGVYPLLLVVGVATAQETATPSLSSDASITLEKLLGLAREHSLDAFKAKRQYGVGYWSYRSFKAGLLPQLNFDTDPFTFNRTLTQRYDPARNIDVYRLQENINSSVNLSMSQNIALTGARVTLNSRLNRLRNIAVNSEVYTANPLRINLSQPLMAFNKFKWQKRTAPLKFEKTKKDFIYALQSINIRAVQLFFDWLLAHQKAKIATDNQKSTKKFYEIGKQRYDLGAIKRDDLLNLELGFNNADNDLVKARQQLRQALVTLKLYLRSSFTGEGVPELPSLIPDIQVNAEEAIALMEQHNPNIINLKIKDLEAQRDLDKTIKENRFDLSIDASYGLNQQANNVGDAYGNLLDQQIVSVNFKMPILDWGKRRGNINVAKMNRQYTTLDLQQQKEKVQRDLTLKIQQFNTQRKIIFTSLKTSKIAEESYEIAQRRFLVGTIDLLNLNNALKNWQNAVETYIQQLRDYWERYYEIRQMTGYDFLEKQELSENFDIILNP